MPQPVLLLKVFLASPNDVVNEREAVRQMLNSLNKALAIPNGLYIEVVGWETDLKAGVGDPQDLINPMVREADLFLGILGNRFGTETAHAGSGTQEEFCVGCEAYDDGKLDDMKLYFRARMEVGSDIDEREAQKILSWKQKIKQEKKLYCYEYYSIEDLINRIRSDLTSWIDSWREIVSIYNPRMMYRSSVDIKEERRIRFLDIEREVSRFLEQKIKSKEGFIGTDTKSKFLEEIAYLHYINLDPQIIYKSRILSQFHGPQEMTISYNQIPASTWKEYKMSTDMLSRMQRAGITMYNVVRFEKEAVIFSQLDYFWYFISKKLHRDISQGNNLPFEAREFINEIHQLLCWMLRKDETSLAQLRYWLNSPVHPMVRNFAAFELGMTQDNESIDGLLRQLKSDPGQNVRIYAAMALGMAKNRKVVPELIKIFQSIDDESVKQKLREAILYLKDVILNPY